MGLAAFNARRRAMANKAKEQAAQEEAVQREAEAKAAAEREKADSAAAAQKKADGRKEDGDSKGADEAPKRLTIPEIKEALAAKEIDIPAGVTKRDDLLALLEAAE